MKTYTNTLADHIAYLTRLTLQTAYHGDELILSGHEFAYLQNGRVVNKITLDDSHYPSDAMDEIHRAIEMNPSAQVSLPVSADDLHELVAALVRTELLRPDLHAQMRVRTSSRVSKAITRLDISLNQTGSVQPLINLQLQFDEYINARETQIIIRHYTQLMRELCAPELCLLAEAAAALDITQPNDLICRIEKHLQVRADR